MELARRRLVVFAVVAWLPLFVLSMIGGHALPGSIKVPFLYDIEAHVRFLVAPILIAFELVVHRRIRLTVRQFVDRRIITPADVPKFHRAIDSVARVRNSVTVEIVILVLVYTLGPWFWRS